MRSLAVSLLALGSVALQIASASNMRRPSLGPLNLDPEEFAKEFELNQQKKQHYFDQDQETFSFKDEFNAKKDHKPSLSMDDFLIDNVPKRTNTTYWQHTLGRTWSGRIPLATLDGDDNDDGDNSSYGNAKYFFWLFEQHPNAINEAKDRLIIWLNGGPGCSSMIGGLQELGPMMMGNDSYLHPNEWGWHLQGSVIFVDQPGGVGMSTTDKYVRSHKEMAFAFVKFLRNFYHIFGDFVEGKDLYISGESYAGHYIPYIAAAIMQSKQVNGKPFPLKSLAIGNAYIDLRYNSYRHTPTAETFKEINFFGKDKQGLHDFQKYVRTTDLIARELEKSGEYHKRNRLVDKERNWETWIQQYLNKTRNETFMFNVYNAFVDRRNDEKSTIGIEKFFADAEVRKELHVDDSDQQWSQCNDAAGDFLRVHPSPGFDRGSAPVYEAILNAGLSVTLYSGNWDLACSSETVERAIEDMKFSGSKGLGEKLRNRSNRERLYDAFGRLAGEVAVRDSLQWIRVNSSGHFVPFDYPQAAITILGRALTATNGWYKPTDNFTFELPF